MKNIYIVSSLFFSLVRAVRYYIVRNIYIIGTSILRIPPPSLFQNTHGERERANIACFKPIDALS